MKKNLFYYLFAVLCTVALFTACSDDDDNANVLPVEQDMAGTYAGELEIAVNNTTVAPGIPQKVYISKSSAGDNQLKLELKDFTFGQMNLGNIKVDPCAVTDQNGTYAFTGKQTLSLAAPLGSCPVTVSGTIKGNSISINIGVEVAALKQTVNAKFDGTKLTGNESSAAAITGFTFDSEFVTEQPVINEETGVITFKVSDAATDDDLEALVPTISISEKATISPASGVAQDFSKNKSVTYTVVAEDGTLKTYVVSISGKMAIFSFEKDEWERVIMVADDEANPFNYWDLSSNGWSTSNEALYMLKGFLQAVDINAPYAVTPTETGYKGGAAEVRSTDSKGMWMMTTVPKVTAGTLFLGTFETDIENTLKSTKFGVMYTEQPMYLKGYYKYQAGETYYKTVVNPENPKDVTGEIVEGKVDKGMISAVLYEVEDEKETLDGTNIYDETKITAIAKQICENTSDFKHFELELKYLKEYDAEKKYKLAIICSSSAEGDKFEGAPGSVLTVDELSVLIK